MRILTERGLILCLVGLLNLSYVCKPLPVVLGWIKDRAHMALLLWNTEVLRPPKCLWTLERHLLFTWSQLNLTTFTAAAPEVTYDPSSLCLHSSSYTLPSLPPVPEPLAFAGCRTHWASATFSWDLLDQKVPCSLLENQTDNGHPQHFPHLSNTPAPVSSHPACSLLSFSLPVRSGELYFLHLSPTWGFPYIIL